MDLLQELLMDNNLQNTIFSFLKEYGTSGLEEALQLYSNMHQEYICKTKTSISKLKICDIYYLEIQKHNIEVHTQHNIYYKYGTLNNELKSLSAYGFAKCNQSCIVSLDKIRTVRQSDIILINNKDLHLSRNYAPQIIMAFSKSKYISRLEKHPLS